ncbi:MAG: glycyl-radical enzyme activating protein [Acutalibacteraceae bacterium]|nr:glycyl-radical enzyme activating protein [Acutalibacteraceae bacterium]
MKGLISGIKRMEIHDGDGLRTTVFFKGCPLKCIWCHNPESISFERQMAFFKEKCCGCLECNKFPQSDIEKICENCPMEARVLFGKEYEADELAKLLLVDKPFFDNSSGGVTFSGGECLAQPQFTVELAGILKKLGVSVYIDTCGFVNREVLDEIIPLTDKFLYDIKAIDSCLHKKLTGVENNIILDNLKYLISRNCSIEIRYPLVKGYNDEEAEKIGMFLKENNFKGKVKILKYHSFAASRYEALSMPCYMPETETRDEHIIEAKNVFNKYKIEVCAD